MPVEAHAVPPAVLRTGRVISGLVVLFLLLDAGMKLVPLQPVLDTMQGLGFSGGGALARGLGVLLLACTVLYAVPRTAPLGALLLTGYLGGAIAVQLRAGNPWFSHVLFGGYLGIALWAGLLLRSVRLRSLLLPIHPRDDAP
jgi:hypothetical protein